MMYEFDVSNPQIDTKSSHSARSARSSVLERARAYNQRIDENKNRTKSLERTQSHDSASRGSATSNRSQSAGRTGNRVSTRERAMQSVQSESYRTTTTSNNFKKQQHQQGMSGAGGMRQSQPQEQQHASAAAEHQKIVNGTSGAATQHRGQGAKRPDPTTPKSSASRGRSLKAKDPASNGQQQGGQQQQQQPQEAVVTPELLVDALSGHEDGLLAIAERLMEHYDAGYDVMGEAIIDAFADVQKLFQHVVEAAHMEGAAFEAQRREAEIAELKKQIPNGGADIGVGGDQTPNGTGGPTRHDEFIDQDVKDVLTEAIRKGSAMRDAHQHNDCYKLYEQACQSASALLPVDSDHRGRLQLSIARAESMSADRACAILRYAMDDVLRSGLRAGKVPLPDVSKRGDCVLSKPKEHPSLNGAAQAGVVQSSEEALASLVEEMKEVLSAPVYDNTPLQDVAKRFWTALGEAQKAQLKTEERLEQALGKLKGEYLLARAEWEEKLTASQEQADLYKSRYMETKTQPSGSAPTPESYMSQARKALNEQTRHASSDFATNYDAVPRSRGPNSVASLGTSLSHHARSIVGSFNCAGMNGDRAGVLNGETTEPMMKTPSRDGVISRTKSAGLSSAGVASVTPSRSSSRGKPRRGRSRTERKSTSAVPQPPPRSEHV